MTGGAIGLAMGIAGVVTSLFFVGQKLLEMSTKVSGLEFLGDYGSAVLAFAAVAIYVPLEHPHCAEARPPARAADRQDAAGGRQLSRRADHAVPPQLPCRGVARRGRAEGDARPALPRHRPQLGEPQQDQCRLHVVRADLQFRGGPHRRLRPEPCALHAERDQPEGLCDGRRTGQLADQPMLVVHPCDAGDRDAEGQCKAGDRSRRGDRERAAAARVLPPHRPFRLPLRHPERGVRAEHPEPRADASGQRRRAVPQRQPTCASGAANGPS